MTLDSWVRFEAQQREAEQADLVKTIQEKVMSDLTDPKMQKDILAQAVADIEGGSFSFTRVFGKRCVGARRDSSLSLAAMREITRKRELELMYSFVSYCRPRQGWKDLNKPAHNSRTRCTVASHNRNRCIDIASSASVNFLWSKRKQIVRLEITKLAFHRFHNLHTLAS